MTLRRFVKCLFMLLVTAASAGLAAQQGAPMPFQSGQGIAPAFEGWYRNPDGTISLSFGYLNRNYKEEIDVPVGANNRIEPGGPDRGQPTHFLPRRQTGIFTVVVPKDFPASGQLTWTITAHGQTNSVPGHIRPEWEIDALKEATSGNTPPLVRLAAGAAGGRGPNGPRTTLRARVGERLPLTLWASDDDVRKQQDRGGPGLGIVWSQFRGDGRVTFAATAPGLIGGQATTSATFDRPGDYVLRALAWDASGGQGTVMAGGFQCCWTNAFVQVTVVP